ncbi:MAG TPA: RNA methyltransferase [Clostridia bacterium]|nr:RNA methyltransferase [Clostridia bacterium]
MKQRKFREAEGKFLVEGVRFVEEALKSDWEVEALICSHSFRASDRNLNFFRDVCIHETPLWLAADNIIKAVTSTQTPQGIVALVRIKETTIDHILAPNNDSNRNPLVLVVDGVQDPGNLGTMIRNADAAGVDGVVLLKGTVDLFNPKALRATMGSLFHIPVVDATIEDFGEKAKNNGVRVFVADPKGQIAVWEADLTLPVALVLANEAHGVSDAVKSIADKFVTIPMPGKAESLNVATSTAIILYEAVKQRS